MGTVLIFILKAQIEMRLRLSDSAVKAYPNCHESLTMKRLGLRRVAIKPLTHGQN